MREHIRVRVAEKSLFIGNLDAAQDQFASLHQLMHIISCSDSHDNLASHLYFQGCSLNIKTYNYSIPVIRRPHEVVKKETAEASALSGSSSIAAKRGAPHPLRN